MSAADEIRRRIDAAGRIPFREFMECALYGPGGYYTRPEATTGPRGDFSTSADVSPAFGRRLAVQVAEIHRRAGGGPWTLAELGPGRGLLAADMLDGLATHAPDALEALERLLLVERSPSLAGRQRARLSGHPVVPRDLRIAPELPPDVAAGGLLVVVANELLDALPVHAIARTATGELAERHVACGDEGRFVEVLGPPTDSRLEPRARRYGLCPRPGDRAEVCLALEELVAGLARAGAEAALFIDYGHRAERLASPELAGGTLVAYHRHRVVEDVLDRPGDQDITAHVNWDHLADAAREVGFETLGPVFQDRFLLALGILEDATLEPGRAPAGEPPADLAARLAARALILPGPGGGRRFQAIALVRPGLGPLRGFAPPGPPATGAGDVTDRGQGCPPTGTRGGSPGGPVPRQSLQDEDVPGWQGSCSPGS